MPSVLECREREDRRERESCLLFAIGVFGNFETFCNFTTNEMEYKKY
jgi:hypothetical protein